MSNLLEQASLVLIPSGYKEDVVYSEIPLDGSGDMSFTRSSNGTRINSAGLVEVCPWNLLQQSETFNVSPWGGTATTATANATLAPNGTLTADKIIATAVTSNHFITSPSVVQTGQFTFSVFAKSSEYSTLILLDVYSGLYGCRYNLSLGTASGTGASIENMGDGWYKCIVTYTSNGTTVSNGLIGSPTTSINYTGDGTSGIYVWGAQLNIGSTAKPYFPTTDRLNVPRLTYQNGGGGCPSLLLEKQSTNLYLYSQEFDNAWWSKNGSTITANNAISPDGTQNADKIEEDATTGQHYILRNGVTVVATSTYSISIYAKKSERDVFVIRAFTPAFSVLGQGTFNLTNGTATGTGTSIVSVGNDWYRCILTYTNGADTTNNFRFNLVSDGNYTGIVGYGLFIWGAQLEAGAYPTTYIPTTSSSATRVADACFKTGISSLIGQTEGTIFVDFIVVGIGSNNINIYNNERTPNTISTNAILFKPNGSIECQTFLGNGTFNTISITASTYTVGQRIKLAYRYKSGDFAMYINGIQKATSTNTMTFVGTKSQIYLDDNAVVYAYQEGVQYNEFVQFTTGLTNAELQALTA